jgi:CBS domain-containing protein
MDSLNNAIRAAIRPSTPPRATKLPCAREIMATDLVVFRPEQPIREVIRMLLKRRISGGPVVSEEGKLVGMISEADCLRPLASGAYDGAPVEAGGKVKDLMNPVSNTIDPAMDIYAIAQVLVNSTTRRLPVLEDGKVIGQVSRRDVLRAFDKHR